MRTSTKRFRKNFPSHLLPVQVSEQNFDRFFLPFLSVPDYGPAPKIPLWKIFNYILYQLHTGCQWHELPIDTDPATGKPEIATTSVWRWFARWSADRSFEFAFVNSVKELRDRKKLRITRFHGDGTNIVAKKGASRSGIPDTSIRGAARLSPSQMPPATSSLRHSLHR
jgi:transposase